ncbi:MAG: LysM peptidoglycan-binding domain-containing protein [Bacillota bacterium]
MQIHIVQPGDTLWAIANKYDTNAQRIAAINGLNDLPFLVVGQALVIEPKPQTYTVQRGDTVWEIAQRYGVTAESIMLANNITDPNSLQPGMELAIPIHAREYGYIEVNGYIEPSTPERDTAIVNDVGRFLTYIAPFSYQVRADGSLNPINDQPIINTAFTYKVAPLMVITNFQEGNFNTELVNTVLNDENVTRTLIDNVIATMREKGYYGLNVDFERISPENREAYNNFLRKVVAALHPLNYIVCTSLAPKPEDYTGGAWHGAHDYRANGEIVDFVILMTYEWGWSGGPPYAVAPVDLVEDVIRYAVSVIPPQKIMMGMPLYGYDWLLPHMPGGPWARRLSPQEAVRRAAQTGARIEFNTQTQAPFYHYYDRNGVQHAVWFEDARSIIAKLMLVVKYGLRGVSYWLLGLEFPQNWAILNDMFNIVKVIP